MPNDSTARAAEALLAYRRGEVSTQSPVGELCRGLARSLGSFDAVDPRTAADSWFLALALELAAGRDAEVRGQLAALATATGRADEDAAPRGVSVRFQGNGNTVQAAGRDLHNHAGPSAAPGQGPAAEHAGEFAVLFAAATPDDFGRTRVDHEARAIRETLERSPQRDRIHLHVRAAVRPHDLTEALLRLAPRVLHLSGHGDGANHELCLENGDGTSHPASAGSLRGILQRMAVECVVLNACHGRSNAPALLESVAYVISTDGPMSDPMAVTFSTGFYQALGAGREVPDAYEWGCGLVRLMRIEGDLPVLDTRAR